MADSAGSPGALNYDPCADAVARYPDWVVRHGILGWGLSEVLCLRAKVILLERGVAAAVRRSSLAHAVAHLDLGHIPAKGWFDRRQEHEADQLAARRLVRIERLAEVARWTRDVSEAAVELDVDQRTLRIRMAHLHPSERALIGRALADIEETA